MGEDLRRLPDAIAHARAARRIFTQNLVLSGGILVALVPLAATGVLGLAAVVASHELAEVLVIGNGIRAGRKKRLPTHRALRAAQAARTVRAPEPVVVPAGRSLLSLSAAPAATCCGEGPCTCDHA